MVTQYAWLTAKNLASDQMRIASMSASRHTQLVSSHGPFVADVVCCDILGPSRTASKKLETSLTAIVQQCTDCNSLMML